MAFLLYKEDFDATRDRLTHWWNGEEIGRPAMLLTVPRAEPMEAIPVMAEPPGWVTHYSTTNFDYRVNLALRTCVNTHYLAEAIPNVSPDLAPNCLALYLGCRGLDQPGTVWCEPFIETQEDARFELDPGNFYWTFTLRLSEVQLREGRDKFLTSFPDLIEGLDTLAAMRDTQTLLMDLVERPDWVIQSLSLITRRYFEVYDQLYDLIKDDRGGSHFWAWAPGRMSKLQCDFSAMISPEMFGEFMVPVLTEMTGRLDYSMYHWDGPPALRHLDHLLSIPRLNMIQWTPGAGAADVTQKCWWSYYHRIVEAGKKPILLGFWGEDNLRAFKREFGAKLNDFMISMRAPDLKQAQRLIDLAGE
jgi:hypothetical protein